MKMVDLNENPDEIKYIAHLRMKAEEKQFQQLKRLTFHIEDMNQFHVLHHSNPALMNYDLIAVRLSDESLLKKMCRIRNRHPQYRLFKSITIPNTR